MFMRMFLAMDGMKTTGQLLCDQEMIESLSDSLALNSVNLTSMLDGATYRPIGTCLNDMFNLMIIIRFVA